MVHISHKKAKSFNCEGYKLYGQFVRINIQIIWQEGIDYPQNMVDKK